MKYMPATLVMCSVMVLVIAGCTRKQPTPETYNIDPWEGANRKIYTFNTKVDHVILRPIAKGYNKITPPPVQEGVTNFFNNVDLITTVPNDILQGKFVYAVSDGWRFLINTTVGIGGLFDVASRLHIPPHHEDFGLTLAYWGMTPQPFLMLPLLGPSSPRDGIGLIADYAASPWPYLRPWWVPTAAVGVRTINYRASLLPADKLLETAFDPYIFVRDAHIQTRKKQIQDNLLTYDQYAAQNRATFSQDISSQDTVGTDLGDMASVTPTVATAVKNSQSASSTATLNGQKTTPVHSSAIIPPTHVQQQQ